MFILIATRKLNDGTKGFRYNILNQKGLVRRRKRLSRGVSFETGKAMKALHIGRLSIYFESKRNQHSVRQLRHWAG